MLRGRSEASLLRNYSEERQEVARDLIAFDQEWARIISERNRDGDAADTPKFQQYFVQHGRYTAGVSVRYGPSNLTGDGQHQDLARGFEIGMRFHSAPVVRLADGKPMHLGHVVKADARWRLFTFADAAPPDDETSRLATLGRFLETDPASPLRRHSPQGADPDSVIDCRAVLQQGFRETDITSLPPLFRPAKGMLGLTDYEKTFCPDLKSGPDLYNVREINKEEGCIVIVRPDQYVAEIMPLDGFDELSAFFDRILLPA